MTVVIHHNPACGTSRNVLEIIRNFAGEPIVIEYLDTGWTRPQLLALFAAADLTPKTALRTSKSPAEELGLTKPEVDEDAILEAMLAHPEMVAGTDRLDTELVKHANEPVVLKSGAEGLYVAMVPGQKLGIALKCADGADRASMVAITALLVRLGVLDASNPGVAAFLRPSLRNWAGLEVGEIRPAESLLS